MARRRNPTSYTQIGEYFIAKLSGRERHPAYTWGVYRREGTLLKYAKTKREAVSWAKKQQHIGNPHGTTRDIPSKWTPAKVARLRDGRIQIRIPGGRR